ncbi:sulfite exporter TauE/SafE family protein [Pseudocnuella soli]|uniref:sulfite exporter TauE/SafE family protein n=1 Tax=Pseudocnuella soli TaxID=2502779 RepID=UPI0010482760|nr:TSUP family transporter [Pseudocnuella soli]
MDTSLVQLLLLCAAAFFAGFVDAIVGGGGLIQTPAALVILPNLPVVNVIGSLKIPAFSGTAIATVQYLRKVAVRHELVLLICSLAFVASFAGSYLLTLVPNDFMKPVLLVVLSVVAVYTYTKKSFGQHSEHTLTASTELALAAIAAILIGFYDGFIGPGTGSFLVLSFVGLLHFNFLKASAHAKLVNLSTNLGSIILFLLKGKIIWAIALPMACCNALGGFVGARLAIARGNSFIRIFFLLVVVGTLLRFLWDVVGR